MRNRFHYQEQDLAKALRALNIARGDTVFCQVGLLKLGLPQEMQAGQSAVQVLRHALDEALGPEGALLTPTYTYSFCRQEIFDPLTSPSRVGPFGEYFRGLEGVERSLEPIFSVAGRGPGVADLFRDLPRDCFGPDCLYQRLARIKAKALFVGVGLGVFTGFHHVEQMVGVPYRFLKPFSGLIRRGQELVRQEWLYSVRVMDQFAESAFQRLQLPALEGGLAREAPVGLGSLIVGDMDELFGLCRQVLGADPWRLAQGPPTNPLAAEEARVPPRLYSVDLPSPAPMDRMAEALEPLPRDLVSDGLDAALAALARQAPLTLHRYPTGQRCLGRLVPERWTCHEAFLETLEGRRLFSHQDDHRHVVSYSLPFQGETPRSLLLGHLHDDPEAPEEIPLIARPFDRDWGLCCSRAAKEGLDRDSYRVTIKTDFAFGQLKVGEVTIGDGGGDCFFLAACLGSSPGLPRGLDGVAVGLEAMRRLAARDGLRHTYRLLLLPGVLGWACYLSDHPEQVSRARGALFLADLGLPGPPVLGCYAPEDSSLVLAARASLGGAMDHDVALPTEAGETAEILRAPGIGLPLVWLTRTLPPAQPASITERGSRGLRPACLDASLRLVLDIIERLEIGARPQ